ncbi:MAG TPA: ABC transporter permease [Bryobacteraceae bacterium]|nr:ABC transporter permease [Bryobacteraceae bacterium]
MNFRNVVLLYRKELTDLLRDRRTVFTMMILPILIMPVSITGTRYVFERSRKDARAQKFRIAVKETAAASEIGAGLRGAGFEIIPVQDVRAAAEGKKADAGLEITPGSGATSVKIYADQSDQIKYGVFRSRLTEVLTRVRDERIRSELMRRGVPFDVASPLKFDHVNLANPQWMMGSMFGTMLSFMLLVFTLNGAMYAAVDMTAGEKERRTMEILLSSAARREEIVLGKVFTAATICFTTAVLSALSLVFGLRQAMSGSKDAEMMAFPTDAPTVALLLLSLVPLTVLVSSVAIALAIAARSTREGMSYAMPVLFVALAVGMSPFLPGLDTRRVFDVLPFAGFTRMIKQIMLGDWSWARFGFALAANSAYAVVAIVFAVRKFHDERVLLRM